MAFSHPTGRGCCLRAISLSGTQGNLDIAVVNADGHGAEDGYRRPGEARRTRIGRPGRPMAGGSHLPRPMRATRRSTRRRPTAPILCA